MNNSVNNHQLPAANQLSSRPKRRNLIILHPEEIRIFDIFNLIFDMNLNKRTQFQIRQNRRKSFYSMNYEQRTTNCEAKKQTQTNPINTNIS
jgi:hypothetical protein